MWIKASSIRINPNKWNERVWGLLILFRRAHRGLLWLSFLLLVYLFAWNKFTPSGFWAISTFKSTGWAWTFAHTPTNCGHSQEKKKFFLRKNILSENSWFSPWILFPQGWLFQQQAKNAPLLRDPISQPKEKPSAACSVHRVLRSIDSHAEHRQFHAQNGYFAPFAELKSRCTLETWQLFSCNSTNVLLQDLKTVLKDLLSFPKRIVSSQLASRPAAEVGKEPKR